MALITDPDLLGLGTSIIVSTANKTVQLAVAGNLTTDGVTLQCVYSRLKEDWKAQADYIKFPFPMLGITEEKFELIDGWNFADLTTRELVRTGGWAFNPAGVVQDQYAGVITLGDIGTSDQVYFQQVTGGSAANIALTGKVNQAVKIYGNFGTVDNRNYFKPFVREYQKTYGMSQLSDIGVTEMTYSVYRFPLADAADLKVIATDAVVDGTALPWSGMSIAWSTATQSRIIGAGTYGFHVIINGNSGNAEQIYTYVQRQLRKNSDIDAGAGTTIGKVANPLLRFVGDSLYTQLYTAGSGSYIDNFLTADTNRLYFTDDTATVRQFPYVAALTIQCGDNLVTDAQAKYWLYFTNDDAGDNSARDYGSTAAILVKDKDNVDITGPISGTASIQRSYDYDYNVQRGTASAAVDAPLTIVAIGLGTAQFVKATGVMARSVTNVVTLVAPLERNYKNP